MANLKAVQNGIVRYLDNEIMSKISGWQKWVIGAGLTMYIDKSDDIFNSLKQNPFIQSLNIINKDDDIDIPTLYKYLSAEAKKGAVTFSVPLIGTITLRQTDVDKIYNYIQGD